MGVACDAEVLVRLWVWHVIGLGEIVGVVCDTDVRLWVCQVIQRSCGRKVSSLYLVVGGRKGR